MHRSIRGTMVPMAVIYGLLTYRVVVASDLNEDADIGQRLNLLITDNTATK